MKIITTDNPIKEATTQVQKLINTHKAATLCFMTGGSALELMPRIISDEYTKGRTIFMMGDDRWSGEPTDNHYLHLVNRLSERDLDGLKLVNTSQQESKDLTTYAKLLNEKIVKIYSTNKNIQTIAIMGVGLDGRTAGIFPETVLKNKSFTKSYIADSTYVPVETRYLRINHRASFTPEFVLNQVDAVVGYGVGEAKKPILESLKNETKPLSEMPAQLLKEHKKSILVTDQKLATFVEVT